MITVAVEDPDTPDVAILLNELSDTLKTIKGSSGTASFDPNDVRVENARFVVARDGDGNAMGCGAFRPLETGVAEIKRMYSHRSGRSSTDTTFPVHYSLLDNREETFFCF